MSLDGKDSEKGTSLEMCSLNGFKINDQQQQHETQRQQAASRGSLVESTSMTSKQAGSSKPHRPRPSIYHL